ncbi:putative cancer susceptibility candidate protein [Plasmopara halstedii]
MGPKKKIKAPKKTKAELEEERRLQEEREARLRAEEEKRLEEDRIRIEEEEARRLEENTRNRQAELARLVHEHKEAKSGLKAKAVRLAELLRMQKEAKDWENYLACQPRPNAEIEVDMNSFLHSWEVDTTTLQLDLPAVITACESATEVMEDLNFVAANACATNDHALQMQCARFLSQLQKLVVEKVDAVTARVLQYADEFADVTPNMSNNINSRGEFKLASASSKSGCVQVGLWVNLFAKGLSRTKRVEFVELGATVDLPKAVIAQSLALRVAFWPFDTFSSVSKGFGNDIALGGVFSLELMAVPTPPKRARGWIMREIPSARDQLKRLHYPLDGMVASTALPIKATYTVPKDVLLETKINQAARVKPRIGWWDTTQMQWAEEGVSDVVYQEDTHSVSFSTLHLTHLALLVRRDRNYHKSSWSLCMVTSQRQDEDARFDYSQPGDNELGDMRASLTLSTAMLSRIQFEITPFGVQLVEPDFPQLEALRKNVLPPGELLVRLAHAGIDLCPPPEMNDVSGERGEGQSPRPYCATKFKTFEDRVIDEIAGVSAGVEITDGNDNAGSCGLAATYWPGAIGNSKQIVFSVKEISWPYMSDDYEGNQEPTGEDESTSIAISTERVLVLAEADEEAKGGGVKFRLGRTDICYGEERDNEDIYNTHVHLRQALDEIMSPDARDRIDNSHVLFEMNLQKMLRLLRLFSFSQPYLLPKEEDEFEKDQDTGEPVTECLVKEKEGTVDLDNATSAEVETKSELVHVPIETI